ncbi:MAG: invasion associated locus B family protein [Marinomonas sp.]
MKRAASLAIGTVIFGLGAGMLALPASAKDHLGVYNDWGAFRDKGIPRCYAIAKAAPSTKQRDHSPFASVATWPARKIRGQMHFRLSHNVTATKAITLTMGDKSFSLTGSGGDAWAKDKRMDAQIVAAMRSAKQMVVKATDSRGRRFSNTYKLAGAATAMDAATLGCAKS